MDWDTWLGAVPYHEYNEKYHQGEWRCWYDFGMGALGDWGAHILDTVHEFLELGLPYEVTLLHEKGIMIISFLILPLFFSASHNAKGCHP